MKSNFMQMKLPVTSESHHLKFILWMEPISNVFKNFVFCNFFFRLRKIYLTVSVTVLQIGSLNNMQVYFNKFKLWTVFIYDSPPLNRWISRGHFFFLQVKLSSRKSEKEKTIHDYMVEFHYINPIFSTFFHIWYIKAARILVVAEIGIL